MPRLCLSDVGVWNAALAQILGWTDKSFSLIRELCLAMKSEGGGVVVILSQRDKTEVEAELSEQFSPRELCGSTVVCRTGSPLLMSDLNKVAGEGEGR